MENNSINPILLKFAIDGINSRIKEIDKEIEALNMEKQELKSAIQVKSPSAEPSITNSSAEGISWWSKAQEILAEANEPLTTGQTVDRILEKFNLTNRKTAIRSVSAVLGVKAKAGKLRNIKEDGKDQKFAIL